MRGKYGIALHEWRGSNPEGSISDKKRAPPPFTLAPTFRLLRKPQSKLAHRELRRFFLKSFSPIADEMGATAIDPRRVSRSSSSFLLTREGKIPFLSIATLTQNRIEDRNRVHSIKRIIEQSCRIKNTRAGENRGTSRRRDKERPVEAERRFKGIKRKVRVAKREKGKDVEKDVKKVWGEIMASKEEKNNEEERFTACMG